MIATLLSIALQAGAPAAPAPASAPVPSVEPNSPLWLQGPRDRELQELATRLRPDLRARGAPASAVIRCRVLADGALDQCVIESESPPRSGLGRGALRLAPKFRLRVNDPTVPLIEGGTIRIPLQWGPPPLR